MGHRKHEVQTMQKRKKKNIFNLCQNILVSLDEDEGLNLEVESRVG